ncbi:Coiled-coil domain-containing protein 25 [Cladochytrium tenue]|nr:Coiled-coil domain-containing protein 25 [Cladochytrium tenue]
MGRDKFENEELIKYGWDEDVWFHVDKLSSAHVYLRMPPGMSWDDIPAELLMDLAQLTKANSIEGNKKDNLTILYTPWSNLKKTPGMETGQVTFQHKQNLVKKVFVEKRSNEIVNRLNKTKVEADPDFAAEKIAKQRSERQEQRKAEKLKKQEELESIEEQRRLAELRDYRSVIREEDMRTNKFSDGDVDVKAYEEDFM